jgi:hypothetical protein
MSYFIPRILIEKVACENEIFFFTTRVRFSAYLFRFPAIYGNCKDEVLPEKFTGFSHNFYPG